MPTNQLELEWTPAGGMEVKVWDSAGVSTDISGIFNKIGGGTSEGRVWSEIQCSADSLIAKIAFQATSKELKFGVTPGVIAQLLQVLVAKQGS